jgi:hypothetical protein
MHSLGKRVAVEKIKTIQTTIFFRMPSRTVFLVDKLAWCTGKRKDATFFIFLSPTLLPQRFPFDFLLPSCSTTTTGN